MGQWAIPPADAAREPRDLDWGMAVMARRVTVGRFGHHDFLGISGRSAHERKRAATGLTKVTSGSGLCGLGLRDHLLERDDSRGEVADRLHVVQRDAVLLPLRYRSGRYAEMGCKCGRAALFGYEPGGKVHANSLEHAKPIGQALSKLPVFRIDLPMDNPRRRRFLAWFKLIYGEDSADARRKFMADSGGSGDKELTKGRVTQLFDTDEAFGELAAKQLATRFGLGADFFLHDRPEFGQNPDAARVSLELQVIADLRDIQRINPEMFAKLVDQLHAVANGARASEKVLGHNPNAHPKRVEEPPQKLKSTHSSDQRSSLGPNLGAKPRTQSRTWSKK